MTLDRIINSQKIEQILLNFIDVLRINLFVVDLKGKPVLVPKTIGYGFEGTTQWGILQHLGKSEFLSQFKTESGYLKAIDNFGFQSFALPLASQGVYPIGYLIVGPVILNKQFDITIYKATANELHVNFLDFVECLNETRVLSFNSLRSILELLSEISRFSIKTDSTERSVPANSIFTTVLELAMTLTQAECGSIMLLNNITNELSILASKGIDPQKLQNVSIKLGEGIAGLAAQKRESFVINDEQKENNRISHLLKKPELKCALVLPIVKNNNEVLGVMNISTHEGSSRLATHTQQMLKSLVEITSETFGVFV